MHLVIALTLASCATPDPTTAQATPVDWQAVAGTITWTADFDEVAEDAGYTDCIYRRDYTGIQDGSAPWLCPRCDFQVLADVEMPAEDLDCYAQVTQGGTPSPVERLGWSKAKLWRASLEHLPLAEFGGLDEEATDTVSFSGESTLMTAPGTVTLFTEGALTTTPTQAVPPGPQEPDGAPSCGWSRAGAPPYDGPWRIRVGKQLPDGLFNDACGEGLRLHQLASKYTVVELSAMDCGPCQAMALDEPAFMAEMGRRRLPVQVVTLLVPSLDAPLDPASSAEIDEWAAAFDLHDPILGDRGWGWALADSAFAAGLAYPTWVVTDPALRVIALGQGYGGWQPMIDAIAVDRAQQW